MQKAEEILKKPGVVIPAETKEILMKCEKAEKLAGGAGIPTELWFELVPTSQAYIFFSVGNTIVHLRASDAIKTMVQNAWSTTSTLHPCVCYDDKGRVTQLCLV